MLNLRDNHDSSHAAITWKRRAAVIRLVDCDPLPDQAINEMHAALNYVLDCHPAHVTLDLSADSSPDSRVIALACDAVRRCRQRQVRIAVRCTPALKAWLTVYQIPLLRTLLHINRPTPAPDAPGNPCPRAA